MNKLIVLCCLSLTVPVLASEPDQPVDATEIVRAAVDHWRGLSSYTEMTMVIHRPDWERSLRKTLL